MSAFLGADTVAPVGPPPDIVTAEDFHRATEAAVLEQAATGEGVILGRGGAAVLRDRPASSACGCRARPSDGCSRRCSDRG